MTLPEQWTRMKEAYFRHLRAVLFFGSMAVGFLLLLLCLQRAEDPPAPEIPLFRPSLTPRLVTAEQLDRMAYTDSALGELRWVYTEDSLRELNRVLWSYDIREPEAISQFLAQAAIETGAGRRLTESGDEAYFQSRGYTAGTRGAGYFHLTYDYGQMAFSVWMMKRYVPELADIDYVNPSFHSREEVAASYYEALRTSANLGLDVSRYSRIVYAPRSAVTTGADYIAQQFAWESAGYYWKMAGIGPALSPVPGVANADIASERVGGSNWQSRREAYLAFYPVLTDIH